MGTFEDGLIAMKQNGEGKEWIERKLQYNNGYYAVKCKISGKNIINVINFYKVFV